LYIVLSLYYLRLPFVIVLSQYYLQLSFGNCFVSVLLTALVCSLYCLCTAYGFPLAIVLSLYYLRFRLVIVLFLYYLWISYGHCIVSVLFTTFVWSLYYLCTTYGFRLVIVMSLYYLRHSFGHYIVPALHTASVCHCIVFVILTAFVWSLYCLCNTYGIPLVNILSLHYIRLPFVIVLSLSYLRLSFGHCIVSLLLTPFL
jgi:hypothetical protein